MSGISDDLAILRDEKDNIPSYRRDDYLARLARVEAELARITDLEAACRGWYDKAQASSESERLIAIAANERLVRLEAAEAQVAALTHERDEQDGRISALTKKRERTSERAEALEEELERIKTWFQSKPWEGDPDPSSHGGHPYSPRERQLGYGSYRDPRFLPASLRVERSSEE